MGIGNLRLVAPELLLRKNEWESVASNHETPTLVGLAGVPAERTLALDSGLCRQSSYRPKWLHSNVTEHQGANRPLVTFWISTAPVRNGR